MCMHQLLVNGKHNNATVVAIHDCLIDIYLYPIPYTVPSYRHTTTYTQIKTTTHG